MKGRMPVSYMYFKSADTVGLKKDVYLSQQFLECREVWTQFLAWQHGTEVHLICGNSLQK